MAEIELGLFPGDGSGLEVDVLIYPEDTHLVVDPYSPVLTPEEEFSEIIERAGSTLPCSVGEVLVGNPVSVRAELLLGIVLMDYEREHPALTAKEFRGGMGRLGASLAALEPESLGFDRFELVERWLSAARILSALLESVGGISSLRRVCFSFAEEACIKRFRIAAENLSLSVRVRDEHGE